MTTETESLLSRWLPFDDAAALAEATVAWLETNVLSFSVGLQLALILAALIPALMFGPKLRDALRRRVAAYAPNDVLRKTGEALAVLAVPIALYLTLVAIRLGFAAASESAAWVAAAIALMNAWIVVRLVTLLIRSPFWSRVAFIVVWPIAALDAFGLLAPIIDALRELTFTIGGAESEESTVVSAWDILRTLLIFGALFWPAAI